MTYQILGRHFTAGVVFEDRVAMDAAPILHYMIGWPFTRVVDYCLRNRWSFFKVDGTGQ